MILKFKTLALFCLLFSLIICQSCKNKESNESVENDSIQSQKEIPNNPVELTTYFIKSLGNKEFDNAFKCAKVNAWGNLEQFSSTKAFGGITSTEIHQIIQEPDQNEQAVVYVEATYYDSVNGDRLFKQRFYLSKFSGEWRILKLETIESSKLNAQEQSTENYAWAGKWTYTNDKESISYELNIEEMAFSRHEVEFSGVGVQTYFKVRCRGYSDGNKIEIHFMGVEDGTFGDHWDVNKPLFTLFLYNNKVYTKWEQLKYSDSPGIYFVK